MLVSFATEPGRTDIPNEDGVAATSNVIVVLDGLTAPERLGTGCTHGTPWYARVLATRVLDRVETGPDDSLATALRHAIGDVAQMHRDTCDLKHPGTPSAVVAILAERPDRVDYLVLADATLVLETVRGCHAITDARVDQFEQEAVKATAAVPIGSAEHYESLDRLISAQRAVRNRPGGYWVAAAVPEAADHALVGSVDRADIRTAAILSDGAARLVDPFGLADWPGILSLLAESGPAELLHRVREAEAEDPDGVRWPRYKRSDDATAVFAVFPSSPPSGA